MFGRRKFRFIILTLFVFSTLLRLVFVFGTPQIPVMWDARLYSSAALGLIYFLHHPGRFGHPERDSKIDSLYFRTQFEYTLKEYIQGEQIEWLYYSIPTAPAAQEYVFLSGPVYPFYLSLIFLINLGSDFTVVRILNVILDGFCLILLMLIGRELFDELTAIVAGTIYIFYLPFILLTGLVLPDIIASLFIMTALWLILLYYRKEKRLYLYAVGLVLGLMVLTKPTGILLFVPFAAGFMYDFRKSRWAGLKPVASAAIPFLLVTIPWLVAGTLYFGTPSLRDPEYSSANFRSSSLTRYEGYDLDYADPDFWIYPVTYYIKSDPFGYARLLIKKFVRLWGKAYNDFQRTFILGKTGGNVYHLLLIITGLFGIFYFMIRPTRGLIYMFTIPLYYSGVHVVFHSLARYNLNAMPLIIIASAAVIMAIYRFLRDALARLENRRWLLSAALIPAGGALTAFFPVRLMVDMLGVNAGLLLSMLLRLSLLLGLLSVLFAILKTTIGAKKSAQFVSFPALVLTIILILLGNTPESWADWKCRLQSPRQIAGCRIYIPGDFRLLPEESVRVAVDLQPGLNRRNPFTLIVNGWRIRLSLDQPPISSFFYNKMTYQVYEDLLNMEKQDMRFWSVVPLKPSFFNQSLDQRGFLDIALAVDDSLPGKDNFLDLSGNFSVSGPGEELIPSLTNSSIERFVEKGDPRIWINYKLSSDSAVSYYIPDIASGRVELGDLSPSAGRQTGRFRIYIEIKRLDETVYYF
jgi:4-amino-4-deoxy-L-arabinose transferase-like glycosyltransferase